MLSSERLRTMRLGGLKLLPGVWKNVPDLAGLGWNVIPLPYYDPDTGLQYRLLLNNYNETLKFTVLDKPVLNRGLRLDDAPPVNLDQTIVALDYEQHISQLSSCDFPRTDLAGSPNQVIHHERGMWLHMVNETTGGPELARLSALPHGSVALSLGRMAPPEEPPLTVDVPPPSRTPAALPMEAVLPIGGPTDINDAFLAPYRHFRDHPMDGQFDPTAPTEQLRRANQYVSIEETAVLVVNSTQPGAGILNTPFINRYASATAMRSVFWIQKLREHDGANELRLQYLQIVNLEFSIRIDRAERRIVWPHISLNTMKKVSDSV